MLTYEFYITPQEYEMASLNGISKTTLEDRIQRYGWKKKKALTHPVIKRSDEVRKWAIIAEQNGIKSSTFAERLSRGMEPEKAATMPLVKKGVSKGGQFTVEELEHASLAGIKVSTLYNRVNKLGWSKEKALNTPTMTNKESLKLATKASPFREMNDISYNTRKNRKREG